MPAKSADVVAHTIQSVNIFRLRLYPKVKRIVKPDMIDTVSKFPEEQMSWRVLSGPGQQAFVSGSQHEIVEAARSVD